MADLPGIEPDMARDRSKTFFTVAEIEWQEALRSLYISHLFRKAAQGPSSLHECQKVMKRSWKLCSLLSKTNYLLALFSGRLTHSGLVLQPSTRAD